ncbi:hypothetical protein [Vibrio sp.]|uniref:hypothetical protein n=1 Tax=Vibrio sp. TaxID=678 RepID=UPI003D0EDCE5
MIQNLLPLLAPMLLGAQLLLTLILVKGDICPGQRGRIHRVLPALGVLWLAVASLKIQAFLVVFAIFYFYSQVQTKKTRDQGPLWVMYLANGLALAYVVIEAFEQPHWPATLSLLVDVLLLGALFSHLLLTIARTRLQAFHRILPVSGVVAAMLASLVVLLQAYQLNEASLQQSMAVIVFGLLLMISAVVVWGWHMFTAKPVNKWQLTISLMMLLLGQGALIPVFVV